MNTQPTWSDSPIHEQIREAGLEELAAVTLIHKFAAVTEQRDRLEEEIKQLKSQLTRTQGAVTISRNGYVQELEQQRDRLAEALRSIKNELGVPQPEYPTIGIKSQY